MNWLLLVLILAYPGLQVKPEWYAPLEKVRVYGHYVADPEYLDYSGWYSWGAGTIDVIWQDDGDGMVRLLFHETMHYLADAGEIGDWKVFKRAVVRQLRSDDCSRNQKLWIRNLMDEGDQGDLLELHAELPWVFEGRIPCRFAAWYPWFDLECAKVKEDRP